MNMNAHTATLSLVLLTPKNLNMLCKEPFAYFVEELLRMTGPIIWVTNAQNVDEKTFAMTM